MSPMKMLGIVCSLLVAGVVGAWLLLVTSPQNDRRPLPVSRPLVTAVPAEPGTAPLVISALGTVKAAQETVIRARVSGQVEKLGEHCDIGGLVKKNDLLIQLDDSVYQNTLSSKKSALAKAQADYELEMGQQLVAQSEAEQLKNISDGLVEQVIISPLALRAPQLAQAKATVQAAEAEVRLARLNVGYSKIVAPYNALVTERHISLGSQASTSDALVTLAGIDEYRIEAAVPLDRLSALKTGRGTGSVVRVTSGAGLVRKGVVIRAVPTLDSVTRMGRVLVSVSDPLGLKNGEPAMLLGDQAQVELTVGTLENVVILPRAALRSTNTVWLAVPDGKTYRLDIRLVTVVWKDPQTVYISSGLAAGELVITSVVPSPVQNMELRLTDEQKQRSGSRG